MIKKSTGKDTVSVIPEDPDDLLNLRRIINVSDRITAETTRTIKQEKEYARPDKGQRVRIRIALSVERLSLDHVLDRLRISGVIIESNNESVSHGSHHSLVVRVGDRIGITKSGWTTVQRRLLSGSSGRTGFLLLAIDTSDCGMARLRGTHLEMLPNIYSGAGGKRYATSFNIERYFERLRQAIMPVSREMDRFIVFGPGQTKKKFANHMQRNGGPKLQIVEGIDTGGEDGIYTFTKSQSMREAMAGSKLARVSEAVDQIMALANKKSKRFTMGITDTESANNAGAVSLLIFSDRSIQECGEDRVIGLLNSAESGGTETFGVDSTTDLGLRVTGLGGIVALLRYSLDLPGADAASQS